MYNLDEIRELSIEKVACELGIKVLHHKCKCFIHDDRIPSLSFNLARNTWHCFGCGEHGDGISLVMRHKGIDFKAAIAWLADRFNLQPIEEGKTNAKSQTPTANSQQPTAKIQHLPLEWILRFRSNQSGFTKALTETFHFSPEQAKAAADRYYLGATRDGRVIFWQLDDQNLLREGKVMAYEANCHRSKQRMPTTISHELKRRGLLAPDFKATPCLFGLHLLWNQPKANVSQARAETKFNLGYAERQNRQRPTGVNNDSSKFKDQSSKNQDSLHFEPSTLNLERPNRGHPIVAIVESEKTAIICSILFPEVLWMATGGKSKLTTQLLKPIAQYHVRGILFPDTDPTGDTYREWSEKAAAISQELDIDLFTSDLLERSATPEQKTQKIDIADLLLDKGPTSKVIPADTT